MATGYGNFVSGSKYGWRVQVVVDVASETATTITYNVYGQFYNEHRITSFANGSVSGGGSSRSWNGSTRNLNGGNPGTTNFASYPVTLNKGGSARTETFSARFQVTGGFGNGTSNASVGVTVPMISYQQPHPPTNPACERVSDTQQKLTWQGDYTGIDGLYPWSNVLVDRMTDEGSWTQIATLSWSAVNYTDNGTSANHRYRYALRSTGPGGTSSRVECSGGPLYTTPTAPGSITASKTSASSVTLSAEGLPMWAEGYEIGRTADGGGSWQTVGTAGTFPWTDASAPAGTIRYRVRSYRGDLHSAYVESNSITTITPPLAPTVHALPSVVATGSALTVQWKPNHPDGSAQEQAQVEYTVGSGPAQTATVQGAGTSYRLPASATASAGTVSVRVRTHGLDDEWGAWSAWVSVRVEVAPQAHFTNPAVDGATVAALPLAVAWEAVDATGISSQTLQLLGADGSVLLTRQLAGDARSLRIDDSVYAISNLTGYTLRLTVLGGSSLSATTQRSFSTDWAEPSLPVAELRVDPSDLSCAVTVLAGEGEGAEAAVAEVPEGKTVGGAVVYGETRQNLWLNPNSQTMNGITTTPNDDGTVSFSGTATQIMSSYSDVSYVLKSGATYTVSVDKKIADNYSSADNTGACFVLTFYGSDNAYLTDRIFGYGSLLVTSITVPSNANFVKFGVIVKKGQALSGTYRVMLNEGSEPEPWCPPGLNSVDELAIVVSTTDSDDDGTTTPIDLDGHALNSLPDGTRDELRIGPDGTAVITKRVGSAEIPGDASGLYWDAGGSRAYFVLPSATSSGGADQSGIIMCDVLPPRKGSEKTYIIASSIYGCAYVKVAGAASTADVADKVGGGTLLYPLAAPQEIELPPAAVSFDGPGHMWADANVPATVKPVYMVGSSFSVTRILPDGSQWLVADGLTDGQQAIDPLPPLNVDFSYIVTSYAETGVSSTQELPAHVDSGGMEAFNFGQGASIALLMGYNASGSESADHGGTLYDFATGDGSLPLFYPTGALAGSASRSYAVTSREHANRVRALSREYPEAWFRDFDGNRMLCRASFSISLVQGSRDVRTIDVTMDECEFEEASNG